MGEIKVPPAESSLVNWRSHAGMRTQHVNRVLPLTFTFERYAENFLGMLYLACCVILLRHL